MDREKRREIRKRGAASRQLTTGNDNIVIKTPKRRTSSSSSSSRSRLSRIATSAAATPKWVPVSQDTGALITEELSMIHSPITRMEVQSTTPNSRKSPKRRKVQTKSKVVKKPQTPKTPRDRINEEYEPKVAQDVFVSRSKPKSKTKTTKSAKITKSTAKVAPSRPQAESEIRKSSKAKAKEPEPEVEEYDDDDGDQEEEDDEDYNEDNLPGDPDVELDDLYVSGTMEVKISRLPTSSTRLTSIDIVLQSLNDALTNEEGKHFRMFQKLNKNYLNKLLDLNLTNNYYLYKLRDLKTEKSNLRNELFEKRQEINENLVNLEKLRTQYNQVRNTIKSRRQISEKLGNLPTPESISNHESILTKLNKLNNIVDPNWGVLDKLKEINGKFLELDQS